ncbi:hypothetical protein CP970_41875 [Streptomyces kanamyceticus]|uniref:Uncharacterized protein n=1 Tax=Streptomyces kanamyceticus TaxID=1967 RepID=A0A5J6GMH1_STRKN|nr:hypothetical protein [Streptomyces kanamyceticus]QEU96629.1 hypothetical protein CP970_41875 [Streptomyces kanamyceticus]
MGTRLSIGRFVAEAPLADERRVARLAESVVRHDLARALDSADVPAGIWCLRRLDVQVTLDGDATDAALRRAWATALATRLVETLTSPGPDVVHYDGPVQAVADLIASTSLGRIERAWAWEKAGVRGRGDPDPVRAPGAAIVAALRRLCTQSPGAGLAALLDAVRQVGLAAPHQALGGPHSRARCGGWPAIAALLAPVPGPPGGLPSPVAGPGSRSTPRGDAEHGNGNTLPADADRRSGNTPPTDTEPGIVTTPPANAMPTNGTTPPPGAETPTGQQQSSPHRTAAAAPPDSPVPTGPTGHQVLTQALFSRSVLARAVGGSRLRPDASDAMAWAALIVAETDPAALARPDADELLRAVAALGDASFPAARADRAYASTTAEPRSAHQEPAGTTPDDTSTGREPAPAAPGLPTRWAGLLFLLSLAPAVGLPHAVLADADLARHPLPWVLRAVAVSLLPLADDDPALAAFSGLDPVKPLPWPHVDHPTAEETRAVLRLGERWSRAAAQALGQPEREKAAVVRGLAARRGTVFLSPGWIEVVLALDEVDVGVRVAGLDLDPGWIPWLGRVICFRYV